MITRTKADFHCLPLHLCSPPSWAGFHSQICFNEERTNISYRVNPDYGPLRDRPTNQRCLRRTLFPEHLELHPLSVGLSSVVSYTSTHILISLILIGILVSYLPQHHRIISRRSSTGISPYFVLLGTTSGTCAFANILNLPASRRDFACCRELNGFECVAGVLGIAQIGVQWSCFMVM